MTRIGWVVSALPAARGVSASVDAATSYLWLRRNCTRRPDGPAAERLRFVLIVPLLREQDLLTAVVERMVALARSVPNSTVVLVTTEVEHAERAQAATRLPALARRLAHGDSAEAVAARFSGVLPASVLRDLARKTPGLDYAACRAAAEAAFAQTPTTPQLAAQAAARRRDGVAVRHLHDPGTAQGMAYQVNYAVRSEIDRARTDGVALQELYFVLYNVDSVPHPDTLRTAAATIIDHQRSGTDGRIFQQSAVFTANLPTLPPGPTRAVIAGAGWLQSRWTLARELPRLRRQARQTTLGRPVRWPRLAHCIGHGLFVRADVYEHLGGLPEATLNEDLAFGYLACAAGIPIHPLPVLEEADTPLTLRSWVDQARRWFRSYPQYPKAAALAADRGFGDPRRRGWLTVQGLVRGCLWLGQSPALAAALILPFRTHRKREAVALVVGAVTTSYLIPAGLTARLINKPFPVGQALPGGMAATLISSVGPWWSLAEAALRTVTGTTAVRGKTER